MIIRTVFWNGAEAKADLQHEDSALDGGQQPVHQDVLRLLRRPFLLLQLLLRPGHAQGCGGRPGLTMLRLTRKCSNLLITNGTPGKKVGQRSHLKLRKPVEQDKLVMWAASHEGRRGILQGRPRAIDSKASRGDS